MKEINLLPDNLLMTPSVRLVQGWYAGLFVVIFYITLMPVAANKSWCLVRRYMQSLQEILEFKDKNADDEKVTYE